MIRLRNSINVSDEDAANIVTQAKVDSDGDIWVSQNMGTVRTDLVMLTVSEFNRIAALVAEATMVKKATTIN